MRDLVALGFVLCVTSLSPSRAAPAPGSTRPYDLVETTRPDGVRFARQVVPAGPPAAAALAQSRVIYLNRTGATLRPGNNDARTNTSTIVNRISQVPAWSTSEATWDATVACFRDLWKELDVTITTEDPGDVPHIEAIFGGSPQHVGMPSGVGGVSPFTTDCSVIENSIVFTFTDVFPDDPQTLCEVMAQEVAHSYGLDHELLASDPMTYLSYSGKRSFKDELVSCGEYSPRACGIGGSVCRQRQNSVALLRERVGVADLVAPELAITSPADGATVAAGFEVTVTATDNVGVQRATLYLDDVPAGTVEGAGPYTFVTDAALAPGAHVIQVEATDGRNTQTRAIAVTIAAPGDDGGETEDPGAGDAAASDLHGGCTAGGAESLALVLFTGLLARLTRRSKKRRRRSQNVEE